MTVEHKGELTIGFFGRDNAFDLAILSDIANSDEDTPETKAAREILGIHRKDNTGSGIHKNSGGSK